ncbi:peptidase M23B [Bacillus cytotoxicus NVH 391-98]|uniref:Peptidase M23B n=1 Tax=Bacillus cytotoxicus (strain DSM 22905 / CIP 110041 / 391-98 / NVH 391-98) TaxID=315749 RepID=A7GNS1_BACCN|nr:peptidase M23B [Bacillus cytotoxicus NVH 391-98]SCN34794.1 Peptidase M23B [Bacillus cytotoxicus]
MVGNHIYIRLDETGTYLVLAHLKKGSVRVKKGQHIKEGTVVANVGNSGNSSEPHLHIHHQRQDPSKTSIFLTEGLPLYFRGIQGPAAPKGGVRIEQGKDVPVGDSVIPLPL